jgi:hypothetical protein
LLGVQEQLVKLESSLHSPEHGMTREALEHMTAEGFWETGASGRRYCREDVIETVLRRYSEPRQAHWQAEDVYCQRVAPELYLFTYTLREGPRVTRRATLWRSEQDRWIAVYHQGTLVEVASGGLG